MKLPLAEAEAVVATDEKAFSAGYGLGRHGWVALTVSPDEDEDRWRQIEEWVRTSYSLVAPKSLARQLPDIAGRCTGRTCCPEETHDVALSSLT